MSRTRIGLQILAAALAVLVVGRIVLQADVATTLRTIGGAGPLILLGLVPFGIGMTFDAWGVVQLLRALGHRTSLAQMLPVRLASEALHITLPAGFVAADAATAVLLERRCQVPVADGVVASIARKWLVMRSHALYIAVGGVAGWGALTALANALHVPALPGIVVGSALVPFVLSAGVGAALLGRGTFARLHRVLARIPSKRLARWLASRGHDAVATDAQVVKLREARGVTASATLAFLGAWCLEALESALLLHLVGARVDLASVFAAEAGLSMVRSIVVFAPSGLGVVDLGYAAVVQAFGVDPAAAAAFVLLRRAKEAVWVLAGYLTLSRQASAGRSASGVVTPPRSNARTVTSAS
ncbi:MAG TPA: lysylphosphatidylglycerol synthase transmembrane domain-containing protein [Polyangiaceae bacterium]|jgi:hypothetical protein